MKGAPRLRALSTVILKSVCPSASWQYQNIINNGYYKSLNNNSGLGGDFWVDFGNRKALIGFSGGGGGVDVTFPVGLLEPGLFVQLKVPDKLALRLTILTETTILFSVPWESGQVSWFS